MFIPGIVIAVATFPGVIVHELAHQLFCRLYSVPVFKVVYFQFENPCGYVLHDKPRTKMQHLMIGIGPFIINTLVGGLIALPASLPVLHFGHSPSVLDILFIYLGFSIAAHAFPSTGDASAIWKSVNEENTPFWVKLVSYPVVGLIYLGAIGSFFWLDIIYGVGVVMGLPWLFINMMY
jgi:hypothetical protein